MIFLITLPAGSALTSTHVSIPDCPNQCSAAGVRVANVATVDSDLLYLEFLSDFTRSGDRFIRNDDSPSIHMVNCTFSDNYVTGSGNGAIVRGEAIWLEGCTFANNTLRGTMPAEAIGVAYSDGPEPFLGRPVLFDNSTPDFPYQNKEGERIFDWRYFDPVPRPPESELDRFLSGDDSFITSIAEVR